MCCWFSHRFIFVLFFSYNCSIIKHVPRVSSCVQITFEFPFVHGLRAAEPHVIFVNLLCTTEGINRRLLIRFLQLCTCAVRRTVLKGHTNKSNLSLADSIPTRCSIAPASTSNNSPPRAPSEALQQPFRCVRFKKVSWAGLILSHYCSSCTSIFSMLFYFFFFSFFHLSS